jgi:hypothetical protein
MNQKEIGIVGYARWRDQKRPFVADTYGQEATHPAPLAVMFDNPASTPFNCIGFAADRQDAQRVAEGFCDFCGFTFEAVV